MSVALAAGIEKEQALRDGGFGDDEISAWRGETTQHLSDAGFSGREIKDYFGEPPEPDMAQMKSYVETNLASAEAGPRPIPPKPAEGILDALEAGFQMSVTGLIDRNKLPDVVLPEHAGMAMRIASQAATLAGDVPAMIAGGVIGGAAGAAAGSATFPIVGTLAGSTIGRVAGAWSAPAAIRTAYMQHLQKGDVKDFSDFWERSSAVLFDALKAGTVGVVTEGAGGIAGSALSKTAAPAAMQTLGKAGVELATMTTVGKAMEGQMPKPTDFVEGALLLAGLHGAVKVAAEIPPYAKEITGKLQDIYARTGLKPAEVLEQAQSNPALKQDLLSSSKDIPETLRPLSEPLQPGQEAFGQLEHIDMPAHESLTEHSADLSPEFSKPSGVRIQGVREEPAVTTPAPERTDAEKAVLDRVKPSEKASSPLTFDQFYTAVVDDLHPVKQLTEALNGGEALSTQKNPYEVMRLTRGAYGKADQFLENAPFSFETLKNSDVPAFKTIVEPFKSDLDGLRAYLVSKRALELNERGIESGIPMPEAKSVVEAGYAKYSKASDDLVRFQNETLKYLKDAGILSQDAFSKMTDANASYVPFYRLLEKEKIGPAGRGINVQNPIREIKGSEKPIIDPLESVIKNTYAYVTLAERNRALSALADLAEKNPEGSKGLMERVPTPMKPIEVKAEEVARFMEEHGIEGTPEAFDIFRPAKSALARDEIAIYRDGKREVYRVSPTVAETIKGLDRDSASLLVKILAYPASTLRAGAVLSPDFIARNFVRDQMTAFQLSKSGFVPIIDSLRGLGSLLSKDEHYQNWLKSGGANSAIVSIDRNYIQENVFKLSKETGLIDKAINVVKSPLELLRVSSELIENSTRLGEFKKAVGEGGSPSDIFSAGLASREVTLDFARIGVQTRAINMVTAFWNAHAQGLDRTIRAFKEDPMGMSAKVAASVTLPSVLLWWANREDPRWQEIPRWQKDLFWIVMTKDHIFRIPKPGEVGVIFGSLPERVLESFFTKNPHAFKQLGETVTDSIAPGYLPTFAIPLIEQFANRSTFTGGPLIPHQLEGLLPPYQFTEYTTESGKMLGRMIGTVPGLKDTAASSPMVIENYVRAWSGNMGRYALMLADRALEKAGVTSPPVQPTAALADIPFVKAFVIRYPAASAQSIQDFYATFDAHKKTIDTLHHLMKTGNAAEVSRLMGTEGTKERLLNLDGIRTALGNQAKMVHMIYLNSSLKPDEKRQMIDGLYFAMIREAQSGNAMMEKLQTGAQK